MTSVRNGRRPNRVDGVSPVFLGLVATMVGSGWAVWTDFANSLGTLAVFQFVVSGWVISLCLHEYAHARTALYCGDVTVAGKGYLTLNPLRYTHPGLSIGLPVLFVVLGGIGLPGGAVYIERGRIPGRWRHSLVSAAGPLTNLGCAVVLLAPFLLSDLVPAAPMRFLAALAFLGMLQITAAVLNLLPVPGLDGYGIIEPWLSAAARRQMRPFAPFGLLIVIAALWTPKVNVAFFDFVDAITNALGAPGYLADYGYSLFRFWGDSLL